MIRRGEIRWADLGDPRGSEPGYRRPVLVVQDDIYNRSRLATVIVLGLTSDLGYGDLPGNVTVPAEESGLDRDSVVNVTQIATVDKDWLEAPVGRLRPMLMDQVDHGLGQVLAL